MLWCSTLYSRCLALRLYNIYTVRYCLLSALNPMPVMHSIHVYTVLIICEMFIPLKFENNNVSFLHSSLQWIYHQNNIGTYLNARNASQRFIYFINSLRFTQYSRLNVWKQTFSLLCNPSFAKCLRLDGACAFALLKKESRITGERKFISFTRHDKRML